MVLHYEFGGDDYHEGDDFEHEVDRDQIVEAIADYMADSFIAFLIRKKNPDKTGADLLRKQKRTVKQIFQWLIKEYDLLYDDEDERDWEDIIKEYWEDEASEQWSESKY